MNGLIKRKSSFGKERIGYVLIAPFALFFMIFIVAPLLINLFLSFTSYNLFSLEFIGLKNYQNLLTDRVFPIAFRNTLIYTFFTLFLSMGGGLAAATFLNRKVPGLIFYRTGFYLPFITSMAAASMIWLWMYEPSMGIFNLVLNALGISSKYWLYDPNLAMICLIIVSVWKNIGYNMIIYLAGLQGIPSSLYEAASVDGANFYQKFIHITVPMLKPVTFFLFITGFIGSFNVFDLVIIMTNGGPMYATTTIAHQIYDRGFNGFLFGYSAAMSMVLFAIVAIITALNYKFGKKGTDIELG
jgi:ABC-type sugar transport system permease subunit